MALELGNSFVFIRAIAFLPNCRVKTCSKGLIRSSLGKTNTWIELLKLFNEFRVLQLLALKTVALRDNKVCPLRLRRRLLCLLSFELLSGSASPISAVFVSILLRQAV